MASNSPKLLFTVSVAATRASSAGFLARQRAGMTSGAPSARSGGSTGGGRGRLRGDRELVSGEVDEHRVTVANVSGEQGRREPVVDLALHEATQRPRPVDGVVPGVGEPGA